VAKRLRGYFLTGLLVLTPLGLTIYVVWNLFIAIDGILNKYVTKAIINIFGLQIKLQVFPGLGIFTLLLIIVFVGFITNYYFGRRLLKMSDNFLRRIPFINLIYTTIQQISEAVFKDQNSIFKKAVLVEFPQKGAYAIGFVTQDTQGAIQNALASESYGVFVPTTPNPTTGFLLFLPKKDVLILDMSIEHALKLVISGGTITSASDGEKEFAVVDKSNKKETLSLAQSSSQHQ
jgi:uncharacterized membrane protein